MPDVKSRAAHAMLEAAKGRLTARFAVPCVLIADGAPQRIGAAGAQHMPAEEA